jgi:hypothetical protein
MCIEECRGIAPACNRREHAEILSAFPSDQVPLRGVQPHRFGTIEEQSTFGRLKGLTRHRLPDRVPPSTNFWLADWAVSWCLGFQRRSKCELLEVKFVSKETAWRRRVSPTKYRQVTLNVEQWPLPRVVQKTSEYRQKPTAVSVINDHVINSSGPEMLLPTVRFAQKAREKAGIDYCWVVRAKPGKRKRRIAAKVKAAGSRIKLSLVVPLFCRSAASL